MSVRTKAGFWLRTLADKIDPGRTPQFTGLSFTFEEGVGIDVHEEGRGCPLWYLGDDYAYAHTEARR